MIQSKWKVRSHAETKLFLESSKIIRVHFLIGQELKEFTYQGAPEVSDATVESHGKLLICFMLISFKAEQQPKKQKFGEGLLSTVGKIGKGVDNFVKKVGNEGVSVGKSLIGKITVIILSSHIFTYSSKISNLKIWVNCKYKLMNSLTE